MRFIIYKQGIYVKGRITIIIGPKAFRVQNPEYDCIHAMMAERCVFSLEENPITFIQSLAMTSLHGAPKPPLIYARTFVRKQGITPEDIVERLGGKRFAFNAGEIPKGDIFVHYGFNVGLFTQEEYQPRDEIGIIRENYPQIKIDDFL